MKDLEYILCWTFSTVCRLGIYAALRKLHPFLSPGGGGQRILLSLTSPVIGTNRVGPRPPFHLLAESDTISETLSVYTPDPWGFPGFSFQSRAARKRSYKLTFMPFNDIFINGPRVFKINEYFFFLLLFCLHGLGVPILNQYRNLNFTDSWQAASHIGQH